MFKNNSSSYWYIAGITEGSEEPRSYIVRDEDGILYRRNEKHINIKLRRHLSPSQLNNSISGTNKSQQSPQICNFNENDNSIEKSTLENSIYTTRTGRSIKPHSRLNL